MAPVRSLAVLLALCLSLHLVSGQTPLTLAGASTLTLSATQYSFNGGALTAADDLNINLAGFALTITAAVPNNNYLRNLQFSGAAGSTATFSNSLQFGTWSTAGGSTVAYVLSAGATVTVASVTGGTASVTINTGAGISSTGAISFVGPATATNSIAGSISGTAITLNGPTNTFTAGTIAATGGNIAITSTTGNNAFSGVTLTATGTITTTATAGTNTFSPMTSVTATGAVTISGNGGNTLSATSISGSALTVSSASGTSTFTAGTYTSTTGAITASTGALVVNGGTFSAANALTFGAAASTTSITAGTVTVTAGSATIQGTTVTVSGGAITASGTGASIGVSGTALTVSGGTLTSPTVTVSGTTSASLGATTIVSANIRIGPAGAFGSIAHPIAGSTFNIGAGSITFNTPTTFNGVVFVTDEWTVDISATGTPLAGPTSNFALTRSSRTINSNLLPAGSGASCVWVTSPTVGNFLVSLPNDILFRNYVSTNPRALTVSSTNGGTATRCTPLITSTLDRRNDVRQNELVYYGGNAVYYLEVSTALPFGAITASDFSVVGGTATVTQLTGTTYAITVAITCDGIVQVNYLGSVTGTGGNYLGIVTTNSGSVVSARCIANIYAPCA